MWKDGIFKARTRPNPARRSSQASVLNFTSRRATVNHRAGIQGIWLLVAAVVLILVAVLLSVLGVQSLSRVLLSENPQFQIRQFDIKTDGKLPVDLIRQYAKVQDTDNLFAVDLRNVHKELLNIPIVGSVVVQRLLPGTLQIRIAERVPLARISVEGLPVEMAVDREGVLLGPSHVSPELPRIDGAALGSLRPGERIKREAVLDALELLDTCDKTRIGLVMRVVCIRLEVDERMILELAQGDRVIFPRTHMDVKLRRLVSILKAIQDRQMREPGKVLEIDMTTESNWPVMGLLG